MKKQLIYIISASVLFVFVAVCLFVYLYPTYFPYNDRFILGSTQSEIEAKYGEFWAEDTNSEGGLHCGCYRIRDNTPELIMSYDNSLWYEIYFTDGVATRIELRRGYIGG